MVFCLCSVTLIADGLNNDPLAPFSLCSSSDPGSFHFSAYRRGESLEQRLLELGIIDKFLSRQYSACQETTLPTAWRRKVPSDDIAKSIEQVLEMNPESGVCPPCPPASQAVTLARAFFHLPRIKKYHKLVTNSLHRKGVGLVQS